MNDTHYLYDVTIMWNKSPSTITWPVKCSKELNGVEQREVLARQEKALLKRIQCDFVGLGRLTKVSAAAAQQHLEHDLSRLPYSDQEVEA